MTGLIRRICCLLPLLTRTSAIKRLALFLLAVIIGQGCALPIGLAAASLTGEEVAREAVILVEQGEYSLAIQRCAEAIPLLIGEGNSEQAKICSDSIADLDIIMQSYPYTLEEARALIREMYPQAAEDDITLWINADTVNRWFYDGQTRYERDIAANLPYRYLDLMLNDDAKRVAYKQLVLDILAVAQAQPDEDYKQYSKPAAYRGTHTLTVPRGELPQEGTLRLWLPIPINTGPQTGVKIESASPEKWLKLPPSVDQDIGLAYFEVPLEELAEDLFIQLAFTFTHYEQHFNINPDMVGEYDRGSALYQEYTRSSGNTQITDEIRQKAREIAGDESNPYRAARKLYDYIVENVTYIFMPHAVFHPRTDVAESDYVHRLRQGDCGAQSM